MKAKFVHEAFKEDSDPIRDMGIGQKPDPKDIKRMEDIEKKAQGKLYRTVDLASTMCKLIKDPDKAYRRYLAANQVFGKDSRVSMIFLTTAKDLGHKEAKHILEEKEKEHKRKYEEELANKREIVKPYAEKFVKSLNNIFDTDATVSTMCSYPYWNDKGLFVDIPYMPEATYSGYTSGGPENVTNYRKAYLGPNMFKVAALARKHDVYLYKDHNNYFVIFPFSKYVK